MQVGVYICSCFHVDTCFACVHEVCCMKLDIELVRTNWGLDLLASHMGDRRVCLLSSLGTHTTPLQVAACQVSPVSLVMSTCVVCLEWCQCLISR